jgi:hypothetical protein
MITKYSKLNFRFVRWFYNSLINLVRQFRVHKKQGDFLTKLQEKRVAWSKYEKYPITNKTILIDGLWDNPNYWIRCSLIISSLGLLNITKVGLLGKYSRSSVRKSFKSFGISDMEDYFELSKIQSVSKRARLLLKNTIKSSDVLEWNLPYQVPASYVYDGILKKQRKGRIDLNDPMLIEYVKEALSFIESANDILSRNDFGLVILSHHTNYDYSPLAWIAIQKGVPVIVTYSYYGSPKFIKMRKPDDFFEYHNKPNISQMNSVSEINKEKIRILGQGYLLSRVQGNTTDVGSICNFQKRQELLDKGDVLNYFSWEDDRPIVTVYTSNWFDCPHLNKMKNFSDFYDWVSSTIDEAVKNKDIYWLFKSHPSDDWYGNINEVSIKSMLPTDQKHIGYVPHAWNGKVIMDATDAAVTYHGTIAIELTGIMGKPVLTADVGWYGDIGFTVTSNSREEYLENLGKNWWKSVNVEEFQYRAQMFAGWFFTQPDWQTGFEWIDDSEQSEIFDKFDKFIDQYDKIIEKEINTINNWFCDDDLNFYHTFKMQNWLN